MKNDRDTVSDRRLIGRNDDFCKNSFFFPTSYSPRHLYLSSLFLVFLDPASVNQ